MKKVILLFSIFMLAFLVGCTQKQEVSMGSMNLDDVGDEFYEKIPVVNAYYEGEEIWFIHPDVTSPDMAERLGMMVGYPVVVTSKHSEVVDIDKLAKLYLFTNGVDHRDEKPWGGGPFFYQIDIFDSIPGDEDYTALRNPSTVTWNEEATPRILTSLDELFEAEKAGELVIAKTDVIVNVPVVRSSGNN